MIRSRILIVIVGVVAVISMPAQEVRYRSNATAQYFGSFQKATNDNGVTHNASNSGGVLATYRFGLNGNHGIEGTYGYTLNTQRYALGGNVSALRTNAHEVSAAYIFSLLYRRVTPFALAGVGVVTFSPEGSNLDSQTRPAFVYGGGADVDLSDRWFMRAQYRGLVYDSPMIGPATVASKRTSHQAQPSIGIGLRF